MTVGNQMRLSRADLSGAAAGFGLLVAALVGTALVLTQFGVGGWWSLWRQVSTTVHLGAWAAALILLVAAADLLLWGALWFLGRLLPGRGARG